MPPFKQDPTNSSQTNQEPYSKANEKLVPEGHQFENLRKTPEGLLYSLLPDYHPVIELIAKNTKITESQARTFFEIVRARDDVYEYTHRNEFDFDNDDDTYKHANCPRRGSGFIGKSSNSISGKTVNERIDSAIDEEWSRHYRINRDRTGELKGSFDYLSNNISKSFSDAFEAVFDNEKGELILVDKGDSYEFSFKDKLVEVCVYADGEAKVMVGKEGENISVLFNYSYTGYSILKKGEYTSNDVFYLETLYKSFESAVRNLSASDSRHNDLRNTRNFGLGHKSDMFFELMEGAKDEEDYYARQESVKLLELFGLRFDNHFRSKLRKIRLTMRDLRRTGLDNFDAIDSKDLFASEELTSFFEENKKLTEGFEFDVVILNKQEQSVVKMVQILQTNTNRNSSRYNKPDDEMGIVYMTEEEFNKFAEYTRTNYLKA